MEDLILTIAMLLFAQYGLIFLGLIFGKYETKKELHRNLIPFSWIVYPFEIILREYKKLK